MVLALQEKAAESQATLLRELEAKKQSGLVEGYTPYWISNLVVVRAQRATIEELANRFDVEQVERNFKPLLIEPIAPATPGDGQSPLTAIGITPGVKAINANKVWYELDIRGEGALVANMDTGVDGNHNALKTRWRGFGGAQPWQECWLDVFGTNTQQPTDTGGHGTHVMGSITGLAVNDTIGVSPGWPIRTATPARSRMCRTWCRTPGASMKDSVATTPTATPAGTRRSTAARPRAWW